MALLELAEKHGDGDFLRELGQWTLQRLMELEAESRCGAGRHERSADRVNHRNGYRERQLEARLGTMELRIPRLRTGSYFRSFLEARKASERALVGVVQEAYVKGVSTRKVDDLVQALGMSGISKSQVSRLSGELDEQIQSFLGRRLDGRWPYLWLDATYLKAREGDRVVSKAVVVPVAVSTEGRREMLGLACGSGDRGLLQPVPARAHRPRPGRRAAGHQRRTPGAVGGRGQGAGLERPALPGALHAQRPGPCASAPASDGRCGHPHRLRPGDPGPGSRPVA